MNLDVNTLFLVTIYVEAILGVLLFFVWIQNTAIQAVAWWGSAHLMRAASITMFGMYGNYPNFITIDLANAILLTSFAVTWMGARVFDGRPILPVHMIYGAVFWLCVTRVNVVAHWPDLRALLSAGIIAAYTWLTAAEFWRGREEALVSRLPTIFMLFAHGALFLLRTPLSALLPWSPTNQVFGSVWLTVLSSEALLFTISIAFLLLAMAKERTEQRHKTAAMLDQLTGVANRRGFLADCERLKVARMPEAQPSAVMLFDLDHFKSVNDRFGHNVGDKVLVVFARTLTAILRPADIVGRLGGEEFAAVLVGIGRERALALGERIRTEFAKATSQVDGRQIDATVSIGVAMNDRKTLDVVALLSQADQALYLAKDRGRNRVELIDSERRSWRSGGGAGKEAPAAAKSAA